MGTGFQLALMLSNDLDSAVNFSGEAPGADSEKKTKFFTIFHASFSLKRSWRF